MQNPTCQKTPNPTEEPACKATTSDQLLLNDHRRPTLVVLLPGEVTGRVLLEDETQFGQVLRAEPDVVPEELLPPVATVFLLRHEFHAARRLRRAEAGEEPRHRRACRRVGSCRGCDQKGIDAGAGYAAAGILGLGSSGTRGKRG